MEYSLSTPDSLAIWYGERRQTFLHPAGECRTDDVIICCENHSGGLRVTVSGDSSPIRFLRLHWRFNLPETAFFLGDAWERSYGDLQWRHMDAGRVMPWYFFLRQEDELHGFGVKTGGSSFAFWSAGPEGITLWLDLRCGTHGVLLKQRNIEVATVVWQNSLPVGSFTAASRMFCTQMCDFPLSPPVPVYGGNNWYYAYGDSSRRDILDDCRRLAGLCGNLPNRPFMVIDDGWQSEPRTAEFNGGPWNSGNERFPEMETLATEMRALDVRPGIWFRPLQNAAPEIPAEWRLRKQILDPTVPEAREWIRADIERLTRWGFELLKHDFSTYDLFGHWGFQANPWLAAGDWSFADRSRTSAEVVTDFYRLIREAAGTSIILGCNTIGHLGAGLMHIARIGDDTSGRSWERTRKMGVNALAFRLGQHRTFFDVDADCVGVTGEIPWAQNREWAELLARSGTPFFASIQPGVLTSEQEMEMNRFFAAASTQKSSAEPLGESYDTAPMLWHSAVGDRVKFNWYHAGDSTPDFQ